MRNPTVRQAVLLIHGIGEQRPMATLRSLVSALIGNDFRSKPDDLSESFELRRLTYDKELDNKKYQTCFFECYWAYRFRDTNYRNVLLWGSRLMGASWKDVPIRLRPVWLLILITVLIAFLFVLLIAAYFVNNDALFAGWLEKVSRWSYPIGAGLAAFSAIFSSFVLYWLGDAARYLDSLPANIVQRQSIRADGVDLLQKLHNAKDGNKPKYDRIIVIGHSLGSVIGYDILKFYWANINKDILIAPGSDAANNLQQLYQFEESTEEYQRIQGALMNALPLDKPWRITDFISLGSPLTYADFLIATSEDDIKLLKKQRELPTCPPQKDEITKLYTFDVEDNTGKIIGVNLHHAAYFALTKWTNFYFSEDKISGEVKQLFGRGIKDVKCDLPPNKCIIGKLFGIRAHNKYWPTGSELPHTEMEQLKEILSWPN